MNNLIIGTSGFSYSDWVGPVYPPGTPAKDFLRLYAREFPMTELNFSFYRQPDPRTMERMVHATPDAFSFAVKAYRGLTHEAGDLAAEIKAFRAGIAPLHEAARLCAVLLQFPHSFHYTPPSRKRLDALCGMLEGYPLAAEFRNDEWDRDSVHNGLRKRNVALVNVDEPDLPGLIKPSAVVTAGHAYVRFHGRNAANWWSGDNVTRYDYLYNDRELEEWLPRIRALMEKAQKVLVAFNNHFRGQAVKNARRLREMAGGGGDERAGI
jgi:uncharacterized protein YecE (DUF72 family)